MADHEHYGHDANHMLQDPLLKKDYEGFTDLSIPSTLVVFTDDDLPGLASWSFGWKSFVLHCRHGILDVYSAAIIFWEHLVSFETVRRI
jgi:hypothetical protein